MTLGSHLIPGPGLATERVRSCESPLCDRRETSSDLITVSRCVCAKRENGAPPLSRAAVTSPGIERRNSASCPQRPPAASPDLGLFPKPMFLSSGGRNQTTASGSTRALSSERSCASSPILNRHYRRHLPTFTRFGTRKLTMIAAHPSLDCAFHCGSSRKTSDALPANLPHCVLKRCTAPAGLCWLWARCHRLRYRRGRVRSEARPDP